MAQAYQAKGPKNKQYRFKKKYMKNINLKLVGLF